MRPARLAFVLALATASAAPAAAQIRASEPASVAQVVDGTRLTVEYSRPRVRGRAPIFGSRAVRWDEVWTPGANWATTLQLSRPVALGGQRVDAGKYSVWMVVRERGPWTLVLEPKARLFHMFPPDSSAAQVRIAVTPQPAAFTEVLTWSFPAVRADGGTLAMDWERTRVAVDFTVEPSLAVALPAADAAPYVGEYEGREQPDAIEKGATPRLMRLAVQHDGGVLRAEWTPEDRYMKRFALIRVAPDLFAPGLYDAEGRIYEVMRPDMMFEFRRGADGRATGFQVRYDDDLLYMTATRRR